MRHNKKINHLGRKYAHREAMLSNMACSLIMHKRIFTTLAKAKELRKYVEPLITKGKEDTTHSRRIVFQNLRDKYAVTELFKEVSQKIGERPGGYTRIIKTGNRLGDNASMCFIELVDYNELMLSEKSSSAKAAKTRRSRRGTKKTDEVAAPKATAPKEVSTTEDAPKKKAAKPKAPKAEAPAEKAATPVEELPVVENTEKVEAVEEAPKAEEVKAETPTEEKPEEEAK